MKDFIVVNISPDHNAESGANILGRSGEGYATQLYITLPEALSSYNAYLDFEKPNGETIRTPKLEVTDGVASYDVSPYVLTEHGELKVQLVLQGANGEVWKSSIKRYIIQKSINAVEDIPEKEDFITQLQALIDKFSGETQEIADILANDAEFSQAVIDACGGQKVINTINGIKLKFFVGTQAEYEELTEAQTQNLFAIITDDTAKENIENAIVGMQTEINGLTSKLENGDYDPESVSYATNAGSAESANKATILQGNWSDSFDSDLLTMDEATGTASIILENAKEYCTYAVVVETVPQTSNGAYTDKVYTFFITIPSKDDKKSTAKSNMCKWSVGTANPSAFNDCFCFVTFSWSDKKLTFRAMNDSGAYKGVFYASDVNSLFVFIGYKLLFEHS